MKQYLLIAQIIVSIILSLLVLLQQRGSSLGSAFGGIGEFYVARRGMEKNIFWATVVFGTLFVALSLINLLS